MPETIAQRQARCTCGALQPSSSDLTFWEDRSPGSPFTETHCGRVVGEPNERSGWDGTCGYHPVAHEPINPSTGRPTERDHAFVQHPGRGTDSFYCGHAGWE